MVKRIVALLMILLFTGSAMAAGLDVQLTVSSSDILSKGALRALNAWLADARLTLESGENAQRVTLYQAGDMLLEVASNRETNVLSSGAWTTGLDTNTLSFEEWPETALRLAGELGELLKDYEKSAAATAELGNVVKAKTQLSYALSAEEWAALWPQVCEILGPQFENITLESKGTFRRYFAADGSEIGAYFYAEKARIAEDDVREVRLEYGYQAEKGLYLAFRCPNKSETRNVRISLSAKRTERTGYIGYSVSGDVRRKHDGNQDTIVIEASLKHQAGALSGKATVNYTKKRDDTTEKFALTVKPALTQAGGTATFEMTIGDLTALAGEISLAGAENAEISLPAVNAEILQVQSAAAVKLLMYLQQLEDSDRLELLYYLNRPSYLTGGEADIYLTYDPEFTVTEEP